MLTIIRLTLREAVHKKIFLLAAVLSVIFLSLFGTGLHYTAEGLDQMPANSMWKAMFFPQWYSMGLYFGSFLVNLFAIFLSIGTISTEIENGILQSIVPKPVRRAEIILGKYTGYGLTLVLFSSFIFAALLVLVKQIGGWSPANLAAGLGLFILQPLILLTLTVWGSTFLATMANGIFVFMLYFLATVGGMVEVIGGLIKNEVLVRVGIVTSLFIPTDAAYRKMVSVLLVNSQTSLNPLTGSPFGTASPPSTVMVVYTFFYLALLLGLAISIFAKKDI